MELSLSTNPKLSEIYDLLIIGGGVNGCGIARDAAGRGLKVLLVEQNDLGSGTSSASTKLFHGGLRYLEYFEFHLVKEALKEREVLLAAMPHISWPMRFILPYNPKLRYSHDQSSLGKLLRIFLPFLKGRRPAWIIRAGLFLYDHLGGREFLPSTKVINLVNHPTGKALKDEFKIAFEYSDCWIQDSRLVILNARDAKARGAQILPHTKFISGKRDDKQDQALWQIEIKPKNQAEAIAIKAKAIVNCGGPWVMEGIGLLSQTESAQLHSVRLVKGSHIVTKALFDHDQPYFFTLSDGRIIFAIPYEQDFTLIGTTEVEYHDPLEKVTCSDQERDYLLSAASQYFKRKLTKEDVVWSYAGVRPLYDDHANTATAATREYILSLETDHGLMPVLNIFGGKITTYRTLSEAALAKLKPFFPKMGDAWNRKIPLAGGDFPIDGADDLQAKLIKTYPFLDQNFAQRFVRSYGTDSFQILNQAKDLKALGQYFGSTLYEAELIWLRDKEWAICAEDAIWRRTRLGLHLNHAQIQNVETWFNQNIEH